MSEKVIFLINQGYEGEVIIVYDHPEGVTTPEEKKKKVYKIPKSGVYKAQSKATYGLLDNEYYYINERGDRTQILEAHGVENPDEVCIYNIITSTKEIEGKEYELMAFMVCKKKDINQYNNFQLEVR
ncbi:MAG: hypothetical protein AAGA66_15865 [Bacteroidota bacterium]